MASAVDRDARADRSPTSISIKDLGRRARRDECRRRRASAGPGPVRARPSPRIRQRRRARAARFLDGQGAGSWARMREPSCPRPSPRPRRSSRPSAPLHRAPADGAPARPTYASCARPERDAARIRCTLETVDVAFEAIEIDHRDGVSTSAEVLPNCASSSWSVRSAAITLAHLAEVLALVGKELPVELVRAPAAPRVSRRRLDPEARRRRVRPSAGRRRSAAGSASTSPAITMRGLLVPLDDVRQREQHVVARSGGDPSSPCVCLQTCRPSRCATCDSRWNAASEPTQYGLKQCTSACRATMRA